MTHKILLKIELNWFGYEQSCRSTLAEGNCKRHHTELWGDIGCDSRGLGPVLCNNDLQEGVRSTIKLTTK